MVTAGVITVVAVVGLAMVEALVVAGVASCVCTWSSHGCGQCSHSRGRVVGDLAAIVAGAAGFVMSFVAGTIKVVAVVAICGIRVAAVVAGVAAAVAVVAAGEAGAPAVASVVAGGWLR